MRKSKQPRDVNQLAKAILDAATYEGPELIAVASVEKNAAAVALGKLGGAKGGRARAKVLSAAERRTIAKSGATARWGKKSGKPAQRG